MQSRLEKKKRMSSKTIKIVRNKEFGEVHTVTVRIPNDTSIFCFFWTFWTLGTTTQEIMDEDIETGHILDSL